jgi:hypothetical protein
MNKLKLNEQGWGDANNALEQEKQEKQKQQQQDLEKQKTDREKKKTTPTPPVTEKNPVNRVGKLVRSSFSKNDKLNPALIHDLEIATKRAKIGDVQITFAISGHDENVDGTKIKSRHYSGDAVDLSMLNGVSYNSNPKLFTTLGNILAAELRKMGFVSYEQNLGKKSLIWQSAGHYHHLHVSHMPDKTMNTQQTEIHKQVQRARWSLYNMITKYPERYFQNFKAWTINIGSGRNVGTDDERAASKYLTDTWEEYWGTGAKTYDLRNALKYAHPHDRENIKTLIILVNLIALSILKGESKTWSVPFWNYDESTETWKQVKRTYRWDYM